MTKKTAVNTLLQYWQRHVAAMVSRLQRHRVRSIGNITVPTVYTQNLIPLVLQLKGERTSFLQTRALSVNASKFWLYATSDGCCNFSSAKALNDFCKVLHRCLVLIFV